MAESFADGLRFLGSARDALPFLWETTIYWALNAFGMWLLAWGCVRECTPMGRGRLLR